MHEWLKEEDPRCNKVLFLDCDGVVNGWRDFSQHVINPINKDCLSMIREVIDVTNSCIVISSVWRTDFSEHGWRRLLTAYPGILTPQHFHPHISTPYLGKVRGDEIDWWLARHPVDKYAIVDDDADMLDDQMAFFVKTSTDIGITRTQADRLVEILT